MNSLIFADLYSRIFDSAIVAIGVTDVKGRYILVNQAWCDCLGYTPEEAIKLTINDVTPVEDISISEGNFAKLTSGEQNSFRLRKRYKRKDGSLVWVDLHVSNVMGIEQEILGVVGVFVNIDLQVKAEEYFKELNCELNRTNKDLQRALSDLDKLARKDSLTGLYNRRILEEMIAREIQRSVRSQRGFGIAIADLDDFKVINDTYGHECGDEALRQLALILRSGIRTTDMVGRWGGEEFLLILPETSCEGAIIVMERIRHQVEKLRLPWQDTEISFTITLGLSYHVGEYDRDTMVSEADHALYIGKKNGKNQSRCFQDICAAKDKTD